MPENNNTNRLNLRSEEVQEILTNPPAWIVRWGITLIFAFTCILLTLSFIIKYPDFVGAKVLVTTKSPTEKVVARYSGRLQYLDIVNRDTVHLRQQLAIIENTADFNDVYFLKSIMDSLAFTTENLVFPIERTSDLSLGDIEPAYINFEKSYVDYFLLKDLDPYSNQLRGNERSLDEIKLRLVNQIKQKELLEKEFGLKQSDFNRHKQLYEKGVISQQEFENKEGELLQIQKNIGTMAISISQMREAISSADQALRSTRINEHEDNTRFLKNLSQTYNTLKKAIRDWEHTYVLSSSIEGVASFQEVWGLNQYVSSGDIVFSILPLDTSDLMGKLTISSQNAGKVTIGQKVLVKLDNYPYQQYGMLIGEVLNISISPDVQGNYVVYIDLPKGTITSYGQKLDFEQELLGNAEIITEDLSIAQRMFYKFKDIFKY
ncbi:HlyD family secretion protein [Maribacter sp. 2304DJ31-5]|uniref:HlyD family secretion protein n=1 Tax=Maribacter sp. 2304DJ31-5 TaxID=3386273 RepID=UPI0039BC97AB